MKRIALFTLLLAAARAGAEYKFGFADINVNRLTWTDGTKLKSNKRDFDFLELEGGANYSWGDMYGFFDFENPGRPPDQARSSAKGTLAYYLGHTALSLYGQIFNFSAMGFSEQSQVFGLQYQWNYPSWWFRPFLGFHEIVQTFYTGSNGYMAGWTVGYDFHLWGYEFLFTDWHEFEFARNAQYAVHQGSSQGHNGAAALWWNFTTHWAMGFQWRYAQNKLGTPGAQGAEIYTLKYNF